MKFSKTFSIGNGLKLIWAAVGVGLGLRMMQMLLCFDYATGFYTDGGLTAALSLLLPLGGAALAGLMCRRSRRAFGENPPGKSPLAGALALGCGAVLLYTGAVLLGDYLSFQSGGPSQYKSVQQSWVHLPFLGACLVFGAVQLYTAAGLFTGKDGMKRVPLLYLTGVLWGAGYLVLTYVFYSSSPSLVENFFMVVGGGALLMGLFYLCRIFAGVDVPGAMLRLFVMGGGAAVLVIPHHGGDLLLLLMGKTYQGEMPPLLQLCGLLTACFLLALMTSCRRTAVDPAQDGAPQEPRHFETGGGE